MKKYFAIIACIGLLGATKAEAAGNYSVSLQANVANFCSLGTPIGPGFSGIQADQAMLQVQTLNGSTTATDALLSFEHAVCTAPSQVTLTLHPFSAGTPVAGLINTIPYKVNFAWGAFPLTSYDSGQTNSPFNVVATTGTLNLEVIVDGDLGPLAPGSFGGTIEMSVAPI